MKLEKDKVLFVGFMLFSMFFGAGNLIFPPFLGQNAGNQTLPSVIGFLITAVILPVLAVMVVVQTEGLDVLTSRVGKKFSVIFTVLLYFAIGPGLAIPRAASVPFEMSIAPYLSENSNTLMLMIAYSVIFFALSGWLSLNPNKLVNRLVAFILAGCQYSVLNQSANVLIAFVICKSRELSNIADAVITKRNSVADEHIAFASTEKMLKLI